MQRILFASCLLILGLGAPALSQFSQYTTPGALAEAPTDAAEQARQEAEAARWTIGPLRIQPRLSIGNLSYDQNVFSAPEGATQVDDLRATVGAGLAGYVRLGSKSLVSAFLAPEYSAWRDTQDLRQLGVNSGLAWFGDFNRLTLSAKASSTEQETPLSVELEVPVRTSKDGLSFDSTLEITRRLAVFVIVSATEFRHERDVETFLPDLDLLSLDRDDDRRVLGVELRGSHLRLGLGYEATEVDFVNADQRDNTGEGPGLRLNWSRNRLSIDLSYADLRIDFEDPGLDTRQTIGRTRVAFRIRPETTVSAYAAEGLAFTAISATGIIETDTLGLAVAQGFGKRLTANAFAENTGQTFVDNQNPDRGDDLEALGLGIRFELTERLGLTGHFRKETLDSALDGFDRSTSSLGFGIRFGGDLLPW